MFGTSHTAQWRYANSRSKSARSTAWIVVDLGLGQEHIQLTQQEVIDAKNGMGVDISRLLNVEVRHNLENPIANSVDIH